MTMQISAPTLPRSFQPILDPSLFNLHEIWLIFRNIIKIIATRCEILKLKCTKFDFGWGSAPDPAGGAYSAPADPLAGFKRAYFKGEGRGEEGGGKEDERGREERGGEALAVEPSHFSTGSDATASCCLQSY